MPWIWVAFWVSLAITIALFIAGLLMKARDPIELIDGINLGKLLHFPTGEIVVHKTQDTVPDMVQKTMPEQVERMPETVH